MLNLEVKNATPLCGYDYPHMETMGERIRALRQARGMTQEQLAAAVGVTKSAVSQWESDLTENIRLKTFMALVEVLKTDVAFLVFGPSRTAASESSRSRTPRTGTA